MASFKGQSEFSIDSKGRVAIPAKMRGVLAPSAKGTFTMTRGLEQCVYLYPLDTWEQMEAKYSALNAYDRNNRDFVRILMMWADEVVLDAQGRVPVSRPLLEFAGITDKALIMGVGNRIEIWDPDSFARYQEGLTTPFDVLAEKVMGGKET